MNELTPTIEQAVLSAAGFLTQRGIQRIVMIDDAFDPISREQLGPQALDNFFAEVEQNEELAGAVKQLGVTLDKVEDLTDEALQKLFEGRTSAQCLLDHLPLLFEQTFYSSLKDADEIRQNLRNLQLEVETYGSDKAPDKTDCKIFLLDYRLGPISQAAESLANAVAKAKGIYAQYTENEEKPVIILMSSEQLQEDQIRRFREDSKLLGGMFQHIPKALLKQRDSLERKLIAVSMSLPVAHVIEALIASVDRSIKSSHELFTASMRSLSLEDYVYIQRLSLKEDGQPFGDYLLWLFSSEFHRRVFESEDVIAKQKDVDALPGLELPPRQIRPSAELAEMYKSALFRTVGGEIETHPQGSADQDYPLLALGDIFIKDKQLYMVMNPECDLAFSPSSDGRSFPATKSILLIPGILESIQSPISDSAKGKPHTELFVRSGETYRISWDPKRVLSQTYGGIREWATTNGFRREYRLRLLYALQIQHDFIAEFGRIGKPTAPPIFQPVRLEIYACDDRSKSKLVLGPIDTDAALVSVKGNTRCAVDLGFIEKLLPVFATCKASLATKLTGLEAKIKEDEALPEPKLTGDVKQKFEGKIKRAQAQMSALTAFEQDKFAQVDFVSNPFEICKVGESISLKKPVGVFSLYFEKTVEPNFLSDDALVIRLTNISGTVEPGIVSPPDLTLIPVASESVN
jgi:hypothetical protein